MLRAPSPVAPDGSPGKRPVGRTGVKFSAEGGGQDQTGQRPGPADRQLAPLAVAWGIVGLCLLLAVELTSLARTHLPRLLWRRVHYAGFALFVTTTAHALGAR